MRVRLGRNGNPLRWRNRRNSESRCEFMEAIASHNITGSASKGGKGVKHDHSKSLKDQSWGASAISAVLNMAWQKAGRDQELNKRLG